MFNLYEILEIKAPDLWVVDVGAAFLDKGDDPYHALSAFPHVKIIGFEPNIAACMQRTAKAGPNHTYLPYFIGDGGRHCFYECANPLTSSLYEPNHPLLAKLQRMDLPVVGTTEVDTSRLDDVSEIGGCDYLKLDIQGAELMAINGAERLLKDALVVHAEVEFVPLYKDQPLFGDVDKRLRELGFMLHKFQGILSRKFKPMVVESEEISPSGQILFAEGAVYVRNFMEFDTLPVEKLINLSSILHFLYGSFDMSAIALGSADKQAGTTWRSRYLERLMHRTERKIDAKGVEKSATPMSWRWS